jgi:hypothetical protein
MKYHIMYLDHTLYHTFTNTNTNTKYNNTGLWF